LETAKCFLVLRPRKTFKVVLAHALANVATGAWLKSRCKTPISIMRNPDAKGAKMPEIVGYCRVSTDGPGGIFLH
jgi:hypothetical protein